MRRGTTATLRFETEQDWAGYTLQLTLKDDTVKLTFDSEDDRLSVSGTSVYITLTQQETLMFTGKKLQAQIKGKAGNSVIATEIVNVKVQPILNEEAM